MSDVEYARAESPVQERAGLTGFVNIAGAAMSVALMIGVAVWGYRLLSRDVSGLPVVRAVEGPMRVQPDDPGGETADHQGLAVNDVAAHGGAAPTADRLVLAPQPVALVDEDRPGEALAVRASAPAAVAGSDPAPAEQALSPEVAALVGQLTGQAVSGPASETDAETPQKVALVSPELLTDDASAGAGETDTDKGKVKRITDDIEIVTGPGLARSLRPVARPAREIRAAAAATEPQTSLDVDPDSLPVGTRLAQLGAYDSPDMARKEWDRLHTRFIDYMDGKQRVVQQASSGGRTFYRLRAMGFADLSDARRFCAVLVAEKADCIPVTTR